MHLDYMINEFQQAFALGIAALVFLGPIGLIWMITHLVSKHKAEHPRQSWGEGYVSTGEYKRSAFGAPWKDVDQNGRDTRNDILARDLTNVVYQDNYDVQSGTLLCPYTNQTITYYAGMRNSVEIDHIVPLSMAWAAGASNWSMELREKFANDPLNLLAVAGSANRAKNNSGPSAWLPPNPDFRYQYMHMFDMVARRYGLVLPPADRMALDRVLLGTPDPQGFGSDQEHFYMSGLAARR